MKNDNDIIDNALSVATSIAYTKKEVAKLKEEIEELISTNSSAPQIIQEYFIGEQGPQGDRGLPGFTGPQGERGDIGPQGEQGIQGIQGERGDMGPQGEQGIQGEKGDQGIQGEIGPRGEKGDKGDIGPQGEIGPKGDKGDQGIQGPQGQIGPRGEKGDRGLQGPRGEKGDKGERGSQGLSGEKGIRGEKGDKGDKGDRGEKGDKGDSGKDGDTTLVESKFSSFKDGIQNDLKNYKNKINQVISSKGFGETAGSGSYWLNDLGDTDKLSLKSATDGQILSFNASKKKWVAADAGSGSVDTVARSLAQSAYDEANTANSLAQNAYDYANTIIINPVDQYARDKANSASSNTIYTQGVDVTQNTNITLARNLAQSAYDYANTYVPYSNTNVASYLTGSITTGNVVVNSVSTGNAFVIIAEPFVPVGKQTWIFATQTGLGPPQPSYMKWPDGTYQYTAFTGTAVDQTARDVASLASSNTIYTQGVDNQQNTWISSNNSYFQGALDSVNTSIVTANTNLKSYTDTQLSTKVNKSGDTITGQLFISNTSSQALYVAGTVYMNQDLNVTGNIYLNGNATTLSANNIVLDDSLIYLAANNPSNSMDIGIVGHFVSNKYQHTGIARDHNDGKWKFFSNVSTEPTTTINFSEANTVYDTVKVGTIEAVAANINGNDLITYIDNINNTQNTRLSTVEANTVYLQGALNQTNTNIVTANTNLKSYVDGQISYISGVDNQQNTWISSNNSYFQGALNAVNTSISSANTQLKSYVDGQISYISGVDNQQNTNITTATTLAQNAYNQANLSYSTAMNAYGTASSAYLLGQDAYDKANTAITTSGGTITGRLNVAFSPATTIGSTVTLTAANTKGGSGYADFLQITNGSGGSTNPNMYLRLNSSGGLELLNSTYSNTLTTISQNGLFGLGKASGTTSNIPTFNSLQFNGRSYVYDDGNMHIQTTGGVIWINSNDGSDVQINTQSPATGGLQVGGNLQINSGYGSVAPVYGVRAWITCGWNGTSMVTYGSQNISVSRSSAGIYVFTFGTNMPDGNYCVSAIAQTPNSNSDVAANIHNGTSTLNSGFTLATARYGDGFKDVPRLCVQVVR